jgi:four helix bundle protein
MELSVDGRQSARPSEGRRNKNRGYQQLRVWQQAIELYVQVSKVFRTFPYALAKIAAQNIASADSVHRNIAEGYCRRSVKEYLQHLYVALGSLGETVSGITACHGQNRSPARTSSRSMLRRID